MLRIRTVAVAAIVAAACFALATTGAAQVNQTQHSDGWILAAAHAPGYHGSIWRTDLWVVFNYVGDSTYFDMYFNKAGQDNTFAAKHQLALTAGKKVYHIEDVVDHFLDLGDGSWSGAIHYVTNAKVQVWARVYSISADGRASYGELVEGIPTADASPDSDPWDADAQQWVYAIQHTADGRFRVNFGIVNPTGLTVQYRVRIFDSTGSNLDESIDVEVPPYSMIQLNDPLAALNGGEWDEIEVRSRALTEDGRGFLWASVVDNATNDAFFIRGVKRMTPSE